MNDRKNILITAGTSVATIDGLAACQETENRNLIFGPLRRLFFFFKMLDKAKDAEAVYALNPVNEGLCALRAARIRKKKFFVKIAGDRSWEAAMEFGKTSLMVDDFQKIKRSGRIKAIHKFQTKICHKADGIVAPSRYMANMIKNWGVAEEKIKIIYDGTRFKPAGLTKEEARKKCGITGNIILSVGRMEPWRGFKMLIKMMPQILKINGFMRLVIAGDGPERKILEAMIKNLNLNNKVYIVGQKNLADRAVYLAASDIFVLNSGYQGSSGEILEAMAAGVPVITTSAGSNREFINQGENGFMVRYNDEFNLMEAIKTLWLDKEMQESFIEEGRKTAEKFNFEKTLKQTRDFLLA